MLRLWILGKARGIEKIEMELYQTYYVTKDKAIIPIYNNTILGILIK